MLRFQTALREVSQIVRKIYHSNKIPHAEFLWHSENIG